MMYIVTRINPDGTDWNKNHEGSWVNYIDAVDTDDAVVRTGQRWEAEAIGLLDFPIVVKVGYCVVEEVKDKFVLDHVVTHSYIVKKMA